VVRKREKRKRRREREEDEVLDDEDLELIGERIPRPAETKVSGETVSRRGMN
jgi:hypothetical protein